MDFIVGLLKSEDHNAIFVVIDRLTKERHYVSYIAEADGTSVEATADMLIRWIFCIHGLPALIVSNRGPQFVAIVWKSFCKRLGIQVKLSTAFYLKIDD